MFSLMTFMLISASSFSAEVLNCKLNQYWTSQNVKELAQIEKDLTAELETKEDGKFKFKNIRAHKHPNFKYLKNILNDKDNLVLKDITLKQHFGDEPGFSYSTKKDGLKINIETSDMKLWALDVKDPNKNTDYLVFLDCI